MSSPAPAPRAGGFDRGPIAWKPRALGRVEACLRAQQAREVLRWALERFAPDVCLATSFGPQTIVLMHLVAELRPETTVFYLDTDLLFPETYALRDRLVARLGLALTRVEASSSLERQAAEHGPQLWARDPELCCTLRKVLPLRRFLADKRAWITGVRRDQTVTRARAGIVEWDDANRLVKVNPLLDWTSDQVWDYLRRHDLPTNELHERGYPSIGCRPCTVPVQAGEDPRAGRWRGTGRTECGIHSNGNGNARRAAEAGRERRLLRIGS
jgi:phosphoadenosine phosphosulfate reductase